MARRWKWIVAGVPSLLLLLLLASELGGGWGIGCGYYTVRVSGRLLDGNDRPVAGAWVMTFPDQEWADKPGFAEEHRRYIEGWELTEYYEAHPLSGGDTTRQDGTFDVYVGVSCSARFGPFGIEWGETERAPFHGARVLGVEREGFPRKLIDCTRGRWKEHAGGEVYATIDLGDVRLR